MSGTVNEVMLLGFIGKDPEVKYSASQKPVATMTMATKEGYGEKERTSWHNLIAFGKTAETIQQYVKKGMFLFVRGTLSYRSWDDATTGKKQYRTEILVDQMNFVPREKAIDSNAGGQQNAVRQNTGAAPNQAQGGGGQYSQPAQNQGGNQFGVDDDGPLPF